MLHCTDHHVQFWPFISQVFLCQGNVHLIPLPANPAELATLPAGTPSLSRALALVRDGGITTIATSPVQQAIHSRISRYVCVCVFGPL